MKRVNCRLDGLVHEVEEVWAGIRAVDTLCGLEYQPINGALTDDIVTCFQCMVQERCSSWQDDVQRCIDLGVHLKQADNDGYCFACGYQDSW